MNPGEAAVYPKGKRVRDGEPPLEYPNGSEEDSVGDVREEGHPRSYTGGANPRPAAGGRGGRCRGWWTGGGTGSGGRGGRRQPECSLWRVDGRDKVVQRATEESHWCDCYRKEAQETCDPLDGVLNRGENTAVSKWYWRPGREGQRRGVVNGSLDPGFELVCFVLGYTHCAGGGIPPETKVNSVRAWPGEGLIHGRWTVEKRERSDNAA